MLAKVRKRYDVFVREYLIDLNSTRAAIAAGYSAKTAGAAGSRLLKNVNVQVKISQQNSKRIEKLEITGQRVLDEIAKTGFSNMMDYVTVQDDGSAHVDLTGLTREQASAINEITVDKYKDGGGKDAREVKKVKLKLGDKLRALELLGDHLGLFKNGGVDKTDRLNEFIAALQDPPTGEKQ